MNTKAILYDLGISLGAVGLWLTPFNASRLLGYSISLVFAGDAYYRGVMLLSKEKKEEEKEAIAYEAETDFYDQLLGTSIEAELEVRMLKCENRVLERMIPLMRHKTRLEKQIQQLNTISVHPEMSEEERQQAAKEAIDNAFENSAESSDRTISEEAIREKFPENLDSTSWKAILKALQNNSTADEIVKDVLGSGEIGKAYYELLKRKFRI